MRRSNCSLTFSFFSTVFLLQHLVFTVDAFISSASQRRTFVAVSRTLPQRHTSASLIDTAHEDCDPPNVPEEITSPVLQSVYPKLLEYIEQYGHPNIPLGTAAGRNCETLRKLQIQDKLTAAEVDLLTQLGFRWHSLEDVYHTTDFQDLISRLLRYAQENQGDLSPPKKYAPDPELGAWVTGLRRLGPDNIATEHAAQLDEIGFLWVSQRKCGSAFMKEYRNVVQRVEIGGESLHTVLQDTQVRNWIRAQKQAAKRSALSETRKHYLEQLLGLDWMETDFDL